MVKLEINKHPGQNWDETANVSIDKEKKGLKDKNHMHRRSYDIYGNLTIAVGLIARLCHLLITIPILSLVFSGFAFNLSQIDNIILILLLSTSIFNFYSNWLSFETKSTEFNI